MAPSKFMGKKRGMTHVFDENGVVIPCTVIECEPNVLLQVKTVEKDGYNAIQLGFDKIKTKDPRTAERRAGKPRMGIFKKASAEPCRTLFEVKVDDVSGYTLGQEFSLDILEGVKYVDVIGTSKGKGYQGVMKAHNFKGGPATHGSGFHRGGGSTGMCSSPGIVLAGAKKPKRLGNKRTTIQNLEVVTLDTEKNLLVVKGSIPGPVGRDVVIQKAVKKNS